VGRQAGKSQVNDTMDLTHCPNRPRNPRLYVPLPPLARQPQAPGRPRVRCLFPVLGLTNVAQRLGHRSPS